MAHPSRSRSVPTCDTMLGANHCPPAAGSTRPENAPWYQSGKQYDTRPASHRPTHNAVATGGWHPTPARRSSGALWPMSTATPPARFAPAAPPRLERSQPRRAQPQERPVRSAPPEGKKAPALSMSRSGAEGISGLDAFRGRPGELLKLSACSNSFRRLNEMSISKRSHT